MTRVMLCETVTPNRLHGKTSEELNRQYEEAVLSLLKRYKIEGYSGEVKYDGTRATITQQNNQVKIVNRHGVDYTRRMPELVKAAEQLEDDYTIDGEIIYINPDTRQVEFTPCQSLTKVFF